MKKSIKTKKIRKLSEVSDFGNEALTIFQLEIVEKEF